MHDILVVIGIVMGVFVAIFGPQLVLYRVT